MQVVISMDKRCHIYHRPGCMYERRIHPRYRMELSAKKAKKLGYHYCKYCGGERGRARSNTFILGAAVADRAMDYKYCGVTDTYYIRTDAGFWKFFWKESAEGFLLYHRNDYDSSASFDKLTKGSFHRQSDVTATESMVKLLNYIEAHDKAKKIIADDYRKLPQKTKKQKAYYKNAARKDRIKSYQRMDRLFDLISRDADNREILACCT